MKNDRRSVAALYVFSFFKSLQFFGAVAVPFYIHRLEMGYARMFTLEMVFSAAMMILEVPTGVVADRWGRKISLCLGSLFLAAGFLMFGIFHSFGILLVAELICALGMTLVSGADRALLYEVLKRDNETDRATGVFARYEAAGTAGLFISFPLGSLFAGSGIVPYKEALGLVFVFTAAALGISGLFVLGARETRPTRDREGRIWQRHVLRGLMRHGIDGFLQIFRTRELRSFGLNYAAISALTFFMFWFYQSLLARHAVPLAWFGFVGSAFNLSAMLLLQTTTFIQKKIGIGKALFLSSIIPGLLYIGAGLFPNLIVALIAMFGVTNLKLFRAPMLSAMMNAKIDDTNRATVLSGISMIERVLIALLYPLVGALADLSLNAALLILGGLTIVASLSLRVNEASL
ncbi:MAG TPA: MFS transporter [Rectinemataceae bacterium]|nr:MFS transporter [Rectinemataceae bacterium]